MSEQSERFVFTEEILKDLQMGDRGLRKAIAAKRFPPADGKLFRRNFWLSSTYERWKAEVLTGKHAIASTFAR